VATRSRRDGYWKWLGGAVTHWVTERRSSVMTTTHQQSITVSAPVESVFAFVEKPERFYVALDSGMKILTEDVRSDQVDGTFRWSVPLLRVFTERGHMRRVDYVKNERIVDESSSGWVFTITTEPDSAGTRLTLKAEESSTIPFLDRVDAAVFRVDRMLKRTLATLKERIEAPTHATTG
jgi:carbon monoxide dehydrogenase subunit G